jgi:PAS domain S-box-containing protein
LPQSEENLARAAAAIGELSSLRGSALEHLLASAAHFARNAICITDAELDDPGPRIVYVNPAFERMTGYTRDEILGRNPRFLQGPDSDRRVLDRLRSDLESGRPFQGETYNYRKDGTPFTMQWRIAAVRDDDGAVTHYVAAQDDISALRGAEAQLRALASRLQRSLVPDLPTFDHFDVAWRYRPVADHALAGGDWYDAVQLESGTLVLFLGDTVGHGDEATAMMGEFRYICRGLVRVHDDPGVILDQLEAAVLTDRPPGIALASMVAAAIDPDGTLRYSVAGHPAPVVRRADGSVDPLEEGRSPLIGASRRTTPRPTATTTLAPGDVFVTFSDGTFERRGQAYDDGYASLVSRLRTADATPIAQCVAAVTQPDASDPDEDPSDDLVALAVALPPPAPAADPPHRRIPDPPV